MVEEMAKGDVIDSLKLLLADSYALYLKTQNYHWNVTGQNFHSLHKMFEDQYSEMADAVDIIAERIRALDAKVPAAFSVFDQASTVADGDEEANSEKMLKELIEDNLSIVDVLYKVADIAANSEDKATEDLAIERIRVHEKNAWTLRASHEFDTVQPVVD